MSDMMRQVEPLIPALRRYARSLVKERAGADDLVQDCLEHVIARWHQRRAEGNVRAWIFTILHNLALNRLRQIARRGPHASLDDMNESLGAIPPAQEDALRHADLLKCLDLLPDEQRCVLLLVSVEDLTYAEAATVLDVPIGTIMSRLARARERLRLLMEGAPAAPFLRRVK